MRKIYDSPRVALEGLLFDGMTIMSGGFGREEPDRHLQQCGGGRLWPVDAAGKPSGAQDDLRREYSETGI